MRCHPEGPEQTGEVDLCEHYELQQDQMQGPACTLGQAPSVVHEVQSGEIFPFCFVGCLDPYFGDDDYL